MSQNVSFYSKQRLSVWRKHEEAFKKVLTQPTVNHSRYVMVWGCFAWSGIGNLVEITGKMDSVMYKGILLDNFRLLAEKFELNDNFVFQHDNDLAMSIMKHYMTNENIFVQKK